MKKIFKALSTLALGVMLVSACNVEHITGTYSPATDGAEVSFVQSVVVNTEIDPQANTFDVTVARNNPAEALTVSVSNTFKAGVTVPSSVTFNAGESTAILTIDVSAMKIGTQYKGTISIADESAVNKDVSVVKSSVTLQKVYTWVSQGKGEWYDNFLFSEPIEVEVLKAENFNRYRVMNPYPKEVVLEAVGSDWYSGGQSAYFDFNINEDGTVRADSPIKTGAFNASVGANAYIWYYYPLDYKETQTAQAALNKTLEGGKIIQFYHAAMIENSTSWYGYKASWLNMPHSAIDLWAWLNE